METGSFLLPVCFCHIQLNEDSCIERFQMRRIQRRARVACAALRGCLLRPKGEHGAIRREIYWVIALHISGKLCLGHAKRIQRGSEAVRPVLGHLLEIYWEGKGVRKAMRGSVEIGKRICDGMHERGARLGDGYAAKQRNKHERIA